jgi:hypothetical protein
VPHPKPPVRRRSAHGALAGLLVAAAAGLALAPAAAHATAVAYLDGGEVWVASLDGSQKARLSSGEGDWQDVAASDGGRVAAVRRKAGDSPVLSTFKVWEPTGAVVNEGALAKHGTWQLYAYPLSFDLSADGKVMGYGYSNSSYDPALYPSPYVFESGHYLLPVNFSGQMDVYNQTGERWPTFAGQRVVSASGSAVDLQADTVNAPFEQSFTPWLDTSYAGPAELQRTDVAATGTVEASELETRSGGTITARKIDLNPVAGLGGTPDSAKGCTLPAVGFPFAISISQDARRIAWKDDRGVVVAGIPDFSGVDTCTLTAPPVVISATGSAPSIGTLDVGPLLPAVQTPGTGTPTPGTTTPGTTTGGGGGTGSTSIAATVPAKLSLVRFTAPAGFTLRLTVPAAGKVIVRATVLPGKLGLKGKVPVVVATGTATAKARGSLAVKLRLTAKGRQKRARLRGAKLTLRIAQGARRLTKTTTLR